MVDILTLNEDNLDEISARAAAALEARHIIAFPTETVYGLGVRADDDGARDALERLKGRPEEKHLALYVAHPDDILATVADPGRDVLMLARRGWPGPITIVADDGAGGTVGFRCPAHPVMLRVADACPFPVAGTSANLSGEPPLTTAAAIAETFGDDLALVIDGGELTGGVASTVVHLPADGEPRVLREGAFTASDIELLLGHRLLFVCTGNTCRSPMAEALGASLARGRTLGGRPIQCLSAGTAAFFGSPASEHSVTAMNERGLDISDHMSRPLTPALLESSDTVLTMTRAHRDAIVEALPEVADKVRPLAGEADIADPIGGDLDDYRECADQITSCLETLLETS